jgi:hypothetical protein
MKSAPQKFRLVLHTTSRGQVDHGMELPGANRVRYFLARQLISFQTSLCSLLGSESRSSNYNSPQTYISQNTLSSPCFESTKGNLIFHIWNQSFPPHPSHVNFEALLFPIEQPQVELRSLFTGWVCSFSGLEIHPAPAQNSKSQHRLCTISSPPCTNLELINYHLCLSWRLCSSQRCFLMILLLDSNIMIWDEMNAPKPWL